MNELGVRVANVGLRLASAGSRFILLLVLARVLSPAEVGQYGLFLATVLLGVAFMGAEFYAYSTRELVSTPRERWSFAIQHSLVAWVMIYAALAPLLWVVTLYWRIGTLSPLWLPAILVAEHLCQEVNRLLVVMGRPLAASWVMFLRMGAWVWLVVPWMWFQPGVCGLGTVLGAWLGGALLALVVGSLVIAREVPAWRRWALDWVWLRRGFGVGLLYFVGSFAFRGMFTLDRYLVEYLVGTDRLGVYVLYVGLATAVLTVLEPAIFSFLNPRLVAAWRSGDVEHYRHLYRELQWSVLGLASVLGLGVALVAPLVIAWIGKPLYGQDSYLLWLLLIVVWICAAGMVLDAALYARGEDRGLTLAGLSALAVFVTVAMVVAQFDRLGAAAYGLLAGFVFAYGVKWRMLRWHEGKTA